MCLTDVNYPIAFIIGTATPTRGRSGYGVSLFTKKDKEIPKIGVSETLNTPLCATASGVLAALRTARKLNLRHINLAFQWSDITDYLEDREYPDEPGTKELFRKIYKSPVKFSVVDYTGCCHVFVLVWSLARGASGTLSCSDSPINDNLFKNGVIEVAISAFARKTKDGRLMGAYGYFFEKDLLNDWGREMNSASVIAEPESEFDVHVEALTIALFAVRTIHKYSEVRIKTASYHIHFLIREFKKNGLERFKSNENIEHLIEMLEIFGCGLDIDYTPNYRNKKIRQAYQLAQEEFKLREESMYWKNGVPRVYTDGSCWRNGQEGAVAGGGVFWGPDDYRNKKVKVYGEQTNNRAEYLAVIHALETAIKSVLIKSLIICVDSQLLIDSIERYLPKWKRNGWISQKGYPVKNRDLLEKIDKLMGKMESVEFEKVLAHSGHEGNEGADRLAREAVRIARTGVNHSSLRFVVI